MLTQLDFDVARLKQRGYAWPIPWQVVETMARFETCALKAYRCQAGVLTCGWGETDGVSALTEWTPDECDERFYDQVCAFTKKVEAMLLRRATPNQLGALVSLAYNIGLEALRKSTVLRKHNEGDTLRAADAFELWNKVRNSVTGQLMVSNGLVRRRAAEKALYLRPEPGDEVASPQAVSGGRWG